jgi:4-amino-4-deoxychorismate lyase
MAHQQTDPEPALIMVPGVGGAQAEPRFHQADPTRAQLLVTDLVATRGEGVFETLGVFDGVAMNVGPHLQRLARSAAMIDLPAPDLDLLAAALDAAIAAHTAVPELTARIMMTRGVEGTDAPTAWIHARTADDYSPARRGMRVVMLDRGVPTTVAETSPWLLAGAKTLSYAGNMTALREARRRGADDALYVSSDGWCLEGPTSTLLVRRGDTFTTTPTEAGVLPGTTVDTVFTALEQDGHATSRELMRPQDVLGSDGAWLLSSGRLAAPIARLDDRELPVDAELTARLNAAASGRG